MEIYWCRKWGFCPLNGSLTRCLSQNRHRGCINLVRLPTEHPIIQLPAEHPIRDRHSAKKERREQRRALRNMIMPGDLPRAGVSFVQQPHFCTLEDLSSMVTTEK